MLPGMAPLHLTRRALLQLPLAAGVVGGVGACTTDRGEPTDPPDQADVTAVQNALATETQLLSVAVALRDPGAVTVLRRHVDLLASSLTPPAPSPTAASDGPSAGPVTVAALAAGLSDASDAHLAALPTVSGTVARALASIAASDRALAAWTRSVGS